MNAELILAVALSLPQYVPDRATDPPEVRAELYRPVATAIAKHARNSTEAAVLLTIAYHETALARYVLTGNCDKGPVGANCDGGRARGPWQVWAWCRGAWAAPDGSVESIDEGAKCAVRLARRAHHKCGGTWEGLFSGFRRLDRCDWPGARKRVSTLGLVQGRLTSQVRRQRSGEGRENQRDEHPHHLPLLDYHRITAPRLSRWQRSLFYPW